MRKIVEYFSRQHLFANFFIVAVLVGGFLFFQNTGKEELPNITFDMVRVSASYQGASAEEIDLQITRELEMALEGIEGIKNIVSTSSQGSCSLHVDLERYSPNRANVVTDIENAVKRVRLPDDVEDPNVREWKSSQKAIIDIALYLEDHPVLNNQDRDKLQKYVDILADLLKQAPSVSSLNYRGYLEKSIEITVNPQKMLYYQISLSQVISALRKSHIRIPVGDLEDDQTTRIQLDSTLDSIPKIRDLVIRASFEGKTLRLSDIAKVEYHYEEESSLRKVNGRQSIILTVTKNSTIGILEAIDEIKTICDDFSANSLKESGVNLLLLDDESVDIRNRLSLIASNGLLGFFLIVIILFLFLDAKSGLWVAMGIPFTLAATMILASLLGYSINNITLAAVIIVMGMVVDDAIVVAENVGRLRGEGMPAYQAVAEGTGVVFFPILASIATTCAAFLPLFFFGGRFGIMVGFIPPIIFLMLGSSLFEALFILPSHLASGWPPILRRIINLFKRGKKKAAQIKPKAIIKSHWFFKVEHLYGSFLKRALRFKWLILLILIGLLVYSGWIFTSKMKFTMFPREETTQVHLMGMAPEDFNKWQTEVKTREVEAVFKPYLGKEVMGFTSSVARGRRGSEARENEFSISIELVPRDQRDIGSKELIAKWQEEIDKIQGFESLRFAVSRFGQSSGSAIDIMLMAKDMEILEKAADDLVAYLEKVPVLANPAKERRRNSPQKVLRLNRGLADRLGISTDAVSSTLRTLLEGYEVFEIIRSTDEISVRISIDKELKRDLATILSLPVHNSRGYLVPLSTVITVEDSTTPDSIIKENGQRVFYVYADLTKDLLALENQKRPQQKEGAGKAGSGKKEPPSGKKDRQEAKGNQKATIMSNQNKENTEEVSAGLLDLPKNMTPLEIADFLERECFPGLKQKYPGLDFKFKGEVEDSRESGSDFLFAALLTLVLIYILLALVLQSLTRPFLILLSIPFGCVGIILALQAHGMLTFGFFSVIGALGLAGVVVNDSIVLLDKLQVEFDKDRTGSIRERVARITQTRLRAVLLTTITTVFGLFPTAYGIFGYDSMLSEMMLTMAWGLVFGTLITLLLVPTLYCIAKEAAALFKPKEEISE